MLERAAAGVERLLVPGYDLPSSRRALALAEQHPAVIQAAVGIHPHFVGDASDADWTELAALAASPRAVAVGEIGLDYFRNLSPPGVQREAFARQLALAADVGKPVLVHDRDAHDDIRATLLAWSGRGVLHAFSGDVDGAGDDRRRLPRLLRHAADVPLRRRPAGGRGSHTARQLPGRDRFALAGTRRRGARNEPTTAVRVAVELSRLRNVPPEEIATQVGGAYDRLLGV